jgi:hypothetical protein
VPLAVAICTPSRRIRYDAMSYSRFAVQVRATDVLPGVATRPVGAVGATVSFGVTEAVVAVDRIPATSIATSV